jgi:predicted MPP superfamily phosphohydrolase
MVPHWMSGALFLVMLSISWALINNALVRRVQSAYGWHRPRHRWLRYVLVVLSFTYIYGRIFERTFGVADWIAVLFHVGAYWVGFATIAFCTFLAGEVVRALVGVLRRKRRPPGVSWVQYHLRPWTGRGMAGLLAVTVALCGYALYGALAPPVVERYELVVPPGQGITGPFRIALLSDLHLGHLGTSEQLAQALAVVEQEAPDLVLIPGDLVDESSPDMARGLSLIGQLRPPLGVYVSLGNHERYSGLEFFLTQCQRHGIHVLRQNHVQLANGLQLAGVDDLRILREAGLSLESALDTALAGIPVERFTLLLFHRPVQVAKAFSRGVDLMVAGHTHGGQLPPFQILSPMANDGHLAGPYLQDGGGLLYVTSGAGFWGPPMRLFAPREVVVIEVKTTP